MSNYFEEVMQNFINETKEIVDRSSLNEDEKNKKIGSAVAAFTLGLVQGIQAFAYYKDGIQCVGTTGNTLIKAYQEISEAYKRITGIDLMK